MHSAAEWVERYSSAAAGLVVAAAFWSVLHPPSYHLMRCVAAALPVWAGYAQTARETALGRVPSGPAVRECSPPASRTTNICVALSVGGRPTHASCDGTLHE